MARPAKIEVQAINLRIDEEKRDYQALVSALQNIRRGVRVHGDSHLAINYYDQESNIGVISKYTEIEIDGEWFDLQTFDVANEFALDELNIPEHLRPNLSQYWFTLVPELHLFVFSSYSESKSLSANLVSRYFEGALNWNEIVEQFGYVESDIVQSYDEVEKILALDSLVEIDLLIRQPNPDEMDEGLAKEIKERIKQQKADELREILRSKTRNRIEPNERTKKLGALAAENGRLKARAIENGVMRDYDTTETPLHVAETYGPEESERTVFRRLVDELGGMVSSARAKLKDNEEA
ncbi:MAG: DUF4747 family protein [Pseudomonadota bacterium]